MEQQRHGKNKFILFVLLLEHVAAQIPYQGEDTQFSHIPPFFAKADLYKTLYFEETSILFQIESSTLKAAHGLHPPQICGQPTYSNFLTVPMGREFVKFLS